MNVVKGAGNALGRAVNLGAKQAYGIDPNKKWGSDRPMTNAQKQQAAKLDPGAFDHFDTGPDQQGQPDQQAQQAQQDPNAPAADIKDTLDANTQYRFPNPDYPGVQIVVRNNGWFIDRLPPQLRGQIKRDSVTGLYPVLQPANIKKYNQYYNQAADAKRVREEPAAAL